MPDDNAPDDNAPDDSTPDRTTPAAPTSATFRAVPRYTVVAVIFFALCLSPFAFYGGYFYLLFLLPVALGWWVLRTRTVVDDEQLVVRTVTGSRRVPWADVARLRATERGWVHVVRADDSEVALVGVRARDLGRLGQVSGGRVSMPTPEQVAADREHARELEATRMRLTRVREQQEQEQRSTDGPPDGRA